MKTIASRRGVILGLGASALGACSPGDTFFGLAETSSSDRPAEGGVGGTGIVGILIGQNRLLINGLSLVAGDTVAVRDAFGPRSLDALAVGQSLTVEAADDGGQLVARSIALVQPLIGPIEAITGSGIRSLGVAVDIEPGAVLAGPDGGPFTPETGQRVAVSGLWRGDGVVASRIDLLDRTDVPVVVAGEVKPIGTAGKRRLGGLELVLPPDGEAPEIGSFVTVAGRRAGAALIAEQVAAGRFQGTAGPLTRLSVEGYLGAHRRRPRLRRLRPRP